MSQNTAQGGTVNLDDTRKSISSNILRKRRVHGDSSTEPMDPVIASPQRPASLLSTGSKFSITGFGSTQGLGREPSMGVYSQVSMIREDDFAQEDTQVVEERKKYRLALSRRQDMLDRKNHAIDMCHRYSRAFWLGFFHFAMVAIAMYFYFTHHMTGTVMVPDAYSGKLEIVIKNCDLVVTKEAHSSGYPITIVANKGWEEADRGSFTVPWRWKYVDWPKGAPRDATNAWEGYRVEIVRRYLTSYDCSATVYISPNMTNTLTDLTIFSFNNEEASIKRSIISVGARAKYGDFLELDSFRMQSTHITLHIGPLKVKDLKVDLQQSSAYLRGLDISGGPIGNATVTTTSGDLQIELEHTTLLKAANSEDAFCLSSPSYHSVSRDCTIGSNSSAPSSNSTTAGLAMSCDVVTKLCETASCSSVTSVIPVLQTSNTEGRLVVQVKRTGEYFRPIAWDMNTTVVAANGTQVNIVTRKGDLPVMTNKTIFDLKAKRQLMDAAPNSDIVIAMKVANGAVANANLENGRLSFPDPATSGVTGMWLASNSIAHLELEPAWSSTFSGGLVTPEIYVMEGRMMSFTCPVPRTLTGASGGNVTKKSEDIQLSSATQQSNPEIMWSISQVIEDAVGADVNTKRVVGFRQLGSVSRFVKEYGFVREVSVNAFTNIYLAAAVVVSFFLAACAGFVAMFFLYDIAMRFMTRQRDNYDSSQRFRHNSGSIVRGGESVSYAAIKKRTQKDGDSAPVSLPNPYMWPSFLYSQYQQYGKGSLSVFLRDNTLDDIFGARQSLEYVSFYTKYTQW